MTPRPIGRARQLATIAAVAMSVACSRASQPTTGAPNPPSGNPWKAYEARANFAAERGKVVYQVQYQPSTVVFDLPSTERALKKISADGATYTLDASVPATAQLKAGSVLFLYGIAIRKVTAVETRGATVTVTTSDADITDAIQNGHIEWKVPMAFAIPTPLKQSRAWRPEDLLVTPVSADISFPLSFETTSQQFESTLSFGVEHGLDIDIKTEYKGPGATVEVHGSGNVHYEEATGSLDIKDGEMTALNTIMTGVEGHVDFEWEGASLDAGAISYLNRDFKITLGHPVEEPLVIGGLPFVLECSAELLLHPAFTSRGAVTKGHFTLEFEGGAGVTTSSESAAPEGEMHAEETIDPESSVTSPNAMSFVAALEMPRFQLALALLPPADFLEVSDTLKFQKIGALKFGKNFYKKEVNELIEELQAFAQPVKPYAFINLVLSTGIFTNGAMTSTLVALPPCQRVQATLSGNEGVGARLNLKALSKLLAKADALTGPKVEFMPLPPYLPKRTLLSWKNDIKCPDDK
jgi:hypothetical protein